MIVTIRTAVLSDLEALSGLFRRASLSNEGDRDHLLGNPDSLVLSDRGIRQGRTRVAIEPDSAAIVGFASLLVKDHMIELEDLFVEPEWMRRGVGRALVLDAMAMAKQQSFDRLEVTANPHAQAFYESAGFTADRVVDTEFYPGQRMHVIVP